MNQSLHNTDLFVKISNFKHMTETEDEDLAFSYLERNGWEEGVNFC